MLQNDKKANIFNDTSPTTCIKRIISKPSANCRRAFFPQSNCKKGGDIGHETLMKL